MRLSLVVALAIGCGASAEIKFTATYDELWPPQLIRFAAEATVLQGYHIEQAAPNAQYISFITTPMRLDTSDAVEVAFLVHVVYEKQTRHRNRFSIYVVPKAFHDGHEVDEDRLPVAANSRAEALSAAIRERARSYEAPPI